MPCGEAHDAVSSPSMAKETITKLNDDLGDGEAVESVTFALRGVEYELDLSAKNVAALEKALERYIVNGRRVVHHRTLRGSMRRASKSSTSNGAASKGQLAAIREWARASGYKVADRGRISGDVIAAYEAAP
jgi:hypothetical protein